MKKRKDDILLFACIEKNIGDDLFIQTICNRYPDKRFIISSKAKYGSLAKIENIKFSKVLELWLLFESSSPNNILKKNIVNLSRLLLRYILGSHDVGVYIVGNAFKNTNFKNATQLNWFKNRIDLTREFYLLSTNFGPYNDICWKDVAHSCFENVTDICFRDMPSYELFSDLPNVRYAPDAILSIGKQDKTENDKTILVSIIDCLFPSRERWLKDLASSYESKIVEIIRAFEKNNYNIVLINSNKEQDCSASNRIKEAFPSENVSIFDYNGDLEKLKKVYSKAQYVIGTRLHTIILAWLYDIPVYPIVYDIKVENMLKSYLYEGKYTLISDIDRLEVAEVFNALSCNEGIDKKIIEASSMQFAALDKRLKG